MLSIIKAKQILSLIKRSNPELNFANISINKGNTFAAKIDLLDENITIVETIKDNSFKSLMKEYIKENLNFDFSSHLYNSFIEVFAFIHEVGHIIDFINNDNSLDNREIQFANYKEAEYTTERERFIAYRNISAEKFADNFAVKMLKKYKYEIWSIIENITVEKAKENEILLTSLLF